MKEKNKFTIYAEQELFDRLKAAYLEDNCRSMNEFAVKAIEFNLGYLSGQQGLDTYTPILSSIIHNAVRDCEERISRNVFKLAVEQAKLSNLTAAFHDVEDSVMRGLHLSLIHISCCCRCWPLPHWRYCFLWFCRRCSPS